MIANARMYSVSSHVAALWRELLSGIIANSGLSVEVIDHLAPAPLEELWSRNDQAAVFMCGLPFARATSKPVLIAAPVPSLPEFDGQARYWSDFVVRSDSTLQSLVDTRGARLALTVPDSQSGCAAALTCLQSAALRATPFGELIAPTITPLGALMAVIDGEADLAPIDAYALRLLRKHRPDLTSRVRVIAQTQPTAIPPLVASAGYGYGLQAAFLRAHENTALLPLMDELLLERFVRPDAAAYETLREQFDAASRYWRIERIAEVIHPDFAPSLGHSTPQNL